jgi:hypothetical protein
MSSSSPLRKLASSVGETLFWTAAQTIFEQATGTKVHTSPAGLVTTGPLNGLRPSPAEVGEMAVGLGAGVASLMMDPKNIPSWSPFAGSSSLSSSFSSHTNSNSLFNSHLGSSSSSSPSFLPSKPTVPLITFNQLLAQTGLNLHGSTVPINYVAHNPIFQKAIQTKKATILKDKATNEEATALDGFVDKHMRLIEGYPDNASLK